MPKALTKKCGRCGIEKPLTEFYHNSTKKDFHNDICSKCQLEVNKSNKMRSQKLKIL
jgi:hypothetical protein